MTRKMVIKILRDAGFVEVARKGSHIILQHPNHEQRVALPVASSKKELPTAIVRTILKVVVEAGIISKDEIERSLSKK